MVLPSSPVQRVLWWQAAPFLTPQTRSNRADSSAALRRARWAQDVRWWKLELMLFKNVCVADTAFMFVHNSVFGHWDLFLALLRRLFLLPSLLRAVVHVAPTVLHSGKCRGTSFGVSRTTSSSSEVACHCRFVRVSAASISAHYLVLCVRGSYKFLVCPRVLCLWSKVTQLRSFLCSLYSIPSVSSNLMSVLSLCAVPAECALCASARN